MYKISANIVCKNEKYWLKESILSIVDLVDEIIYVDNESTDGSLDIVKNLSSLYSNIKIFTHKDHNLKNLGDLKNFALSQSKNEFVLRWDADFIAYDDIINLFDFCLNNKDKFDGYLLTGPNLCGDIYHQPKNKDNFGPECYLFKKNKMKFKPNKNYPDYPNFENGFKYCYTENTKLSKNFFFLHTNTLKSIERLTFRRQMCDYHLSKTKNDYWDWLSELNGTDEIKEKEMQITISTKLEIKPFDVNKWGNLPKILENSKSASLFKIKLINGDYFIDYPKD